MGRQFIRLPGFLEDQIPLLEPSAIKILTYVYSKSFFENGKYSPIEYGSTIFSRILSMSRTTVTDKVAQLESIGYLIIKDKLLYPLEKKGNKECPIDEQPVENSVRRMDVVNKVVQSMNTNVQKMDTIRPIIEHFPDKTSIKRTYESLFERLTQGFESPLVFLKYIYSNSIVLDADDFIKILENMHRIEVFKLMRKQKIDKDLTGFDPGDKFDECKRWVRELYKEHDDPQADLPLDRYLLYLLVEAIETKNNPAGRFISAVQKLKSDGTRFEIDMSFYNKEKATTDASEQMALKENITLKMIEKHERMDRESILEDEKREQYIASFPQDVIDQAMETAREVARKEMSGLFSTKTLATGDGERKEAFIELRAKRNVTTYLKIYEKDHEKLLTSGMN